MNRTLFVALLASAALSGGTLVHAQSASQSMPRYDDGQPPDPQGYYDREDSSDARRDDPRAAQQSYRQAPDSRDNSPPSVSPLASEDAAHRADRARTAELNQNGYRRPGGWNGGSADQQTQYQDQVAEHARDMRDYRAARARYAVRIAQWRARADACEAGNIDACEGPQN